MEHIIPRSRGGDDSDDNTALACATCNNAKGDRTPLEWVWQQHGAWPELVNLRHWRYPETGRPARSAWVPFPLSVPPSIASEVREIAARDALAPSLNTVFVTLLAEAIAARKRAT